MNNNNTNILGTMETERVNEETHDGNYVIEILDSEGAWRYVLTEFSASVATTIAVNLHNATGSSCRVLSRRSHNMVLAEI